MSRDELHEIANKTTPSDVEVPNTYIGLIVWAVSKFGIGIIFAAMLVPVYLDNKEANGAILEMTRANINALHALANEVRGISDRIDANENRYRNQ